jgi:hypothetical protein
MLAVTGARRVRRLKGEDAAERPPTRKVIS